MWKSEGEVRLPGSELGFTKIVVDVEENLAKEIKSLWLWQNPVTKIKGAEKLVNVKEISCLNCRLNSIPRWIEKLPAIEEVDLSWNNINQIPAWFTQIKTLKRLNLGSCKVQSLPHDLFHYQLEEVDVSGNKGKQIAISS